MGEIAGDLIVQGRFPLDGKYWVNSITDLNSGLTFNGLMRYDKSTDHLWLKISSKWVRIPTTDDLSNLDLTNYFTKNEINTLLNQVNNRIDGLVGGNTDNLWENTTIWLDQTVINSSNETRYCDNILYRKIKDSTYQRRVLVDNTINMNLYLVGDGVTDNVDRWSTFVKYMQQATRLFTITLLNPASSNFYSSEPIQFSGLRLIFKGEGTYSFDGNQGGFIFLRDYNDYYRIKKIKIEGINKIYGVDGFVDPTTSSFTTYCNANNIPLTITKSDGQSIDYKIHNTPAGSKIESFDPKNYHAHGIYTTTILNIDYIQVAGFSGHGIYFYAPAIQQNTNCSMSYIDYAEVKQCGGYGIVVEGADANQIRVTNFDCRENGLVGVVDLSQSGTRYYGGHTAVNGWGGYWLLSNGKASLFASYQETDASTYCIFAGSSTILGNIISSGAIYGFNSFGIDGSTIGAVKIGSLNVNQILFGESSDRYNYLEFANRPINGPNGENRIHLQARRFSGAEQLFNIFDKDQTLLSGRVTGFPGVAIGSNIGTGTYILDRLHKTTTGLNPPSGVKYQKGDKLYTETYRISTNAPNEWMCISGGLAPNDTYASACGITVTLSGSQRLVLAKPSNFVQSGDIVLIDGNTFQVVSIQPISSVDSTQILSFEISSPISFTGSKMIDYPTAIFKAINNGAYGATNQRPTLQNGGDIGYDFLDLTINKKVVWNGNSWI